MKLTLELFGERQIAGRLLKTAGRVEDASPWFRMMHGWLERELDQQFYTQGTHWGSGWKPLSPSYAAQKAADGYGDEKILHRTGRLMRSLTEPHGADAVRLITPRQMWFGSSVTNDEGYRYGEAHQLGLGRNPQRRMLELLRQADVRRVTRSLGLYIVRDVVKEPTDMSGLAGGRGR